MRVSCLTISCMFALISVILSCQQISLKNNSFSHKHLEFSEIEKIKLGSNFKAVEELLDLPDLKVSEDSNQEAWLYLDGQWSATRLSLIFDKTTSSLMTINWFVKDSDSESVLAYAQAKFPHAKFVQNLPEWSNPHFGPDQIFYTDASRGIDIILRKSSGRVSSIRIDTPGNKVNRRPSGKIEL